MKRRIASLLLSGLLVVSRGAIGGETVLWTYSGEKGPENWARLTPEFSACNGKNQSPIDLTGFIEADLHPLLFSYAAGGDLISNNGHAVQVNYAAGSTIVVDDIQFALKQFHFHVPSENRINGNSYTMEVHLVHADKDDNLAVVALVFEQGEENDVLAELLPFIPDDDGRQNALPTPFDVADLLPSNRDYYRYSGSLTTPPCTEGVRWLVLKTPVLVSKEQVVELSSLLRQPNNRPIQPINARTVLQ